MCTRKVVFLPLILLDAVLLSFLSAAPQKAATAAGHAAANGARVEEDGKPEPAPVVLRATASSAPQAAAAAQSELDARVRAFLDSRKNQWREENITEADGRFLYDLILKHRYTRALEIGTSTGHSGIWQAWALSKTGGHLITIEIDEFRHLRAVQNFKASGLESLIDARLADANDLVEELPGPFDFVFIDADKNRTLNYFETLLPKLTVGGCFAVHNVSTLGFMRGIQDFLEYVRRLDYMETTVDKASGISLSFKKRNPA